MKISLLSDIHIEWDPDYRIVNHGSDVLILSGDIGVVAYLKKGENSPYFSVGQSYINFLADCCAQWNHVIYVFGNHEYYHGYIDSGMSDFREYIANIPSLNNLIVLDNESVILDGVKFIGSTLWFDANGHNPVSIFSLNKSMNDFRLILDKAKNYRRFMAEDAVRLHDVAKSFIIDELGKSETQKTVVCTHHSPSYMSIDEKYKNDFHLNGGYHSDLTNIMLEYSPTVWTHGHTHDSFDYTISNTRIICNPKGYKNENKNFNNRLIFEV